MRIWAARIFIGLVLGMNVDCAVAFLAAPGSYAPGFDLQGIVGEAVIRSYGILFLMWNVPYMFALWHPRKNHQSLIQAVIMQAVGLVGETLLYISLPAIHTQLRGSILRFIVFDGAGLAALCVAWLLISFGKSQGARIEPQP